MKRIEEILMERDSLTFEEAKKLVEEATEEFHARIAMGEMPYDFCQEWFNLEPDYLDQLL